MGAATDSQPGSLGIENLFSIVRNSSCTEYTNSTNDSNFTCISVDKPSIIPKYWMSIILLASNELRITFKLFFSTNEVKSILAKRLKKNPDEITQATAHDYMREYCNSVVGSTKRELGKLDVDVGLGLPIVTRAFDEVFRPHKVRKNVFVENFNITSEDKLNLCFHSSLEVLNWGVFEKIENYNPNTASDEDDDDDMDFL